MKNNQRCFVLIPLLLSGCASTTTTANQDAQFSGHPSRIFVVYRLEPLDAVFDTDFENLFRKRMEIPSCPAAAQTQPKT
jgi:hypothetical protein